MPAPASACLPACLCAGNFSVAMDDGDDDSQHEEDMQLLAATAAAHPPPPPAAGAAWDAWPGQQQRITPTSVTPGPAAGGTLGGAADDADMDMVTPAPFAFPSAAGRPLPGAAAAAAPADGGLGLGLTQGVLSGAAPTDGAGGAAWRANLMHLLGPGFEAGQGSGIRFGASTDQQQQQQQAGVVDFTTPGSDMFTPAVSAAAVAAGRGAMRGGLFDTPLAGGGWATSPAPAAAAAAGTGAAVHAQGRGAAAGGRSGRGAGRDSLNTSGAAAAGSAAGAAEERGLLAEAADQLLAVAGMSGVGREVAQAAIQQSGGDLLQALAALRQQQQEQQEDPARPADHSPADGHHS